MVVSGALAQVAPPSKRRARAAQGSPARYTLMVARRVRALAVVVKRPSRLPRAYFRFCRTFARKQKSDGVDKLKNLTYPEKYLG